MTTESTQRGPSLNVLPNGLMGCGVRPHTPFRSKMAAGTSASDLRALISRGDDAIAIGVEMTDITFTSVRTHHLAQSYCLAPLVFAAATRHGLVFLNLASNRYSGIGCADSSILCEHVPDLPRLASWLTEAGGLLESDGSNATLLESLAKSGILALKPAERCEIVSTQIPLDGSLTSVGEEITCKPLAGPWQIAVFLFCLAWSAASLRFLPLRYIVRRIHRRRVSAILNGYEFNVLRTAQFVATFRAIRPFFLVPKDKCLLCALTLIEYLAHHNEYPVLVFGVKTDPWGAHAWVQEETFILDSSPEKVCHLEQILGA